MSDHVYKRIHLTGSSTESIDGAIQNAISKAAETVHNLRWFEVDEIRGHIENGHVAHFQVSVQLGFTLD